MSHPSVSLPSIVFSDLDGTLIDDDKNLPPLCREALDELYAQGIPFVPCTGRVISAIPDEILHHPAVTYAISAAGVLISDVTSMEVVQEWPMRKEDARMLFDAAQDRDVIFDIFERQTIWSSCERLSHISEIGLAPGDEQLVLASRTPTDTPLDQVIQELPVVDRVSIYWKDPQDRDALAALIEKTPTLAWTCSHMHNMEILSAGANKGVALKWLCDFVGADVAQSWAFGDSTNDIEMLEAAGHSFVTANATPDALRAAQHVIGTNNDGGVGAHLLSVLKSVV